MPRDEFKDLIRQNKEALEFHKQLRLASGFNNIVNQHEETRRLIAEAGGINAMARQQQELRKQIFDARPFFPKTFASEMWGNKNAHKGFLEMFAGAGNLFHQFGLIFRDAKGHPPWLINYAELKRGITDVSHLYRSRALAKDFRDFLLSSGHSSFGSVAQAVAEAKAFDISRLGGTRGSAGLAALDFTEIRESLAQIHALHESFAGQVAETLKASVEAKESSEDTARALTELIETKLNSLPSNRLTAEGLRDTVLQIIAILIALAVFAYETLDSNRSDAVQTEQLTQLIAVARQVVENTEPQVSKEDSGVYYVVERQLQLKVKPETKSPSVAILFPNQRVRLVQMSHQWIYVEYFDFIEGLPKYGWAYKKYLKRA